MKRLVVLSIFLFCITISLSIASAENRWCLVSQSNSQSDQVYVYLDTYKVRSYGTKADPYLDCWLKWVNNNSYNIQHTFINAMNQSYMIRDVIWYDNKGNVTTSYNREADGWKQPTPDSVMESAITDTLIWATSKGY